MTKWLRHVHHINHCSMFANLKYYPRVISYLNRNKNNDPDDVRKVQMLHFFPRSS